MNNEIIEQCAANVIQMCYLVMRTIGADASESTDRDQIQQMASVLSMLSPSERVMVNISMNLLRTAFAASSAEPGIETEDEIILGCECLNEV